VLIYAPYLSMDWRAICLEISTERPLSRDISGNVHKITLNTENQVICERLNVLDGTDGRLEYQSVGRG
jgi:hypothetical protein